MNVEEAANYSQLPSLQNSSFQYTQPFSLPFFVLILYMSQVIPSLTLGKHQIFTHIFIKVLKYAQLESAGLLNFLIQAHT